MFKKAYTEATIEFVRFDNESVMTASSGEETTLQPPSQDNDDLPIL